MTGIFDTHTHLNDKYYSSDLDGAIARAADQGVDRIICPGYDLPSSRRAVEIARSYDNVWATVGVHPHDAESFDDKALAEVTKLAAEPRVVAIGEIGLDYYRDLSPRPAQISAFKAQIRLAKELDLPVVIHNRDAGADVIRILEEECVPPGFGVMHCFSEDVDYAMQVVDLGLYVGIAGPVTYTKNDYLREVAEKVPIEKILVETDAPYLTPEPFRGRRRNEPALVRLVAEKVAELRNLSLETFAQDTTANALRLFRKIGVKE